MTWRFLYLCVWLHRGWDWLQSGLLLPAFCPLYCVPALFCSWSLSLPGESIQGPQLAKQEWCRGDCTWACSAAWTHECGVWPQRHEGQCWERKSCSERWDSSSLSLRQIKSCKVVSWRWWSSSLSCLPPGGPHVFFLLCAVSFCCFPCVGSGIFLILC